MIAAGDADASNCDALRGDPAFEMAVGRLPESGSELCSQPTMSRLENLPTRTALKRMMDAGGSIETDRTTKHSCLMDQFVETFELTRACWASS